MNLKKYKEYMHSHEYRDKMSKIMTGKNTWSKGRKLSKEHIEKIRLSSTGRLHTDEAKRKVGLSSKGRVHSEESKRKNGDARRGKKMPPRSEEFKTKMREIRLNNPYKIFKDTSIELKVEAELQKRGIIYQKQVPLCKIAIVDFYLPEYRIIIQCDGCYYHNCPIHHPNAYIGIHERSTRQDSVLTFNGFNVFRFWEHEINKSVEECIDKINFYDKTNE